MRQVHAAAALLLALMLAACASAPSVAPVDWEQQQARLAALDHFTASGKIALRSADQAESGSLLWQQAGNATHIRLAGPMGLAATTVDSDGEVLELRQGEEYSRWRLDDPAIAQDSTWDIPLGALVYWLKGMPAPGLAVEALQFGSNDGLPMMLRQDGWTIQYGDFATFQGYTLPTRLEARREDSSARIILREWRDLSAHDRQP
jgi:outer membrane lipoprotein LolB